MNAQTAWTYLLIAGVLEIAWAAGMKYTQGFTRPLPSFCVLSALVLSFYFLSQALKGLPVGTAYAVWTGIGAAGTAVLGVFLFKEPVTPARIFCLAMIVGGVAGLKVFSKP